MYTDVPGLGLLEIFSERVRAEIISQIPYWQARVQKRHRDLVEFWEKTNNLAGATPELRQQAVNLRYQLNEIEYQYALFEDTIRKAVAKAIAEGRVKREDLPNGLGALVVFTIAIALVVVAALGYLASVQLARAAEARKEQVLSVERVLMRFYESWDKAAAARAQGSNVPMPPAPTFPGSGGGGTANTVATAGIGLTTLLVAGGLLFLFAKGGKRA